VGSSPGYKIGFATEKNHHGEARFERRLTVQRNALQPEVLVCSLRHHGVPEPSRMHQLIDLFSASAPAFDRLQC
jgi:hypothetical protein